MTSAPSRTSRAAVPGHLQHLARRSRLPRFRRRHRLGHRGLERGIQWLYPAIAHAPETDRNLLWLVYTDPQLRRAAARTGSATAAGSSPSSGPSRASGSAARGHQSLLDRLRAASPDFRAHWSEIAVERFTSRRRHFLRDGELLTFEHHRLVPSEAPDLHVVMYVPAREA